MTTCGEDIYYIVLKKKGGAVKEGGKVKKFTTPDAALKHINFKMGGSPYTSIKTVCKKKKRR